VTADELQRYYDVSLPPSLTGGGGGGEEGDDELPGAVAQFTIGDIQAWVDDHPDDADEVLAVEDSRGDAARVTLLRWLEGFIAHRDDDLDEDDDD
jgi:ABC-type nitrate/sulfonate/bicarbonate transport system substrate-binding protein